MLTAYALLFSTLAGFALQLNTGSFPKPLSSELEREYLLKAKNGDPEARNKLIEHNLRLVAHIMKKYYSQASDQEDLVSIGTFGLIKAISTFNPDKGIRLATYAARCVENEILMYFRSQRKSASDISLSDYIDSGDEGTSLSVMDVIHDGADLFEHINGMEELRMLRKYMEEVLEDRERNILILRYGLNGQLPMPQREVAARCGLSRSYISRIEKKALGKLRQAFQGSDS